MRAIILAAGMGRRAYPLSKNKPKCLFKVDGKSLIHHQIEKLREFGISEIFVVVGYQYKQIEKEIGGDVKMLFSPFYTTTNSIVSLWLAKHELIDTTLIINGDIFIDKKVLGSLINDKQKQISMVVEINPTLQDSDFKLLIHDGHIIDMGKMLASFSGEYVGIVKVPKDKIKAYVETLDEMVKRLQVNVWHEIVLMQMITKGFTVIPFEVPAGSWFEIDTVSDVRKKSDGEQKAS
jgi:choline kinase